MAIYPQTTCFYKGVIKEQPTGGNENFFLSTITPYLLYIKSVWVWISVDYLIFTKWSNWFIRCWGLPGPVRGLQLRRRLLPSSTRGAEVHHHRAGEKERKITHSSIFSIVYVNHICIGYFKRSIFFTYILYLHIMFY